MTEAGNSVHLTPKDPHILNDKTGERTELRKEGSVYVMDLWVKLRGPPGIGREAPKAARTRAAAGAKKVTWDEDVEMAHVSPGFTRQGR